MFLAVENANSRPILYLFWIDPSIGFCNESLIGAKYAVAATTIY
jgi:hypothetical protein